MVAYTERMLASWKDGQGLDVHEAMMRLTLDIVAKTLFDTDVSREAEDVGAALQFLMGKFMRQAAFAFLLPDSIPSRPRDGCGAPSGSSTRSFTKSSAGAAPAARCLAICSVFFCRLKTMKASA